MVLDLGPCKEPNLEQKKKKIIKPAETPEDAPLPHEGHFSNAGLLNPPFPLNEQEQKEKKNLLPTRLDASQILSKWEPGGTHISDSYPIYGTQIMAFRYCLKDSTFSWLYFLDLPATNSHFHVATLD